MSEQKVTPFLLLKKKQYGQKVTMLTAYDCPIAKFINKAGIDIILVSDALGTVGLGRPEAISVSVDEIIYHTQAVRNGAGTSMVAATLPFGSYDTVSQAVNNSVRIIKEGHADAIHLEGDKSDAPKIKAIFESGIPVIGHLGVVKQKIVRVGKIQVQGRNARDASNIIDDALAFANAGSFALVLECIPHQLGRIISNSLEIPTIGIGAGPFCDGQALVTQDMLGLFKELSPRFLKVYLNLSDIIIEGLKRFRSEVEGNNFPTSDHSYEMSERELNQLVTLLNNKNM